MNIFKKTLNKFNGNLCFLAETESLRYAFECDRYGRSVSYATTDKNLSGVCVMDVNSYLLCFGENNIGVFDGNSINELYKATPFKVDAIANGSGYFYIWSNEENAIFKISFSTSQSSSSSSSNENWVSDVSIIWKFDLPYGFVGANNGRIFYRRSSDIIVFMGNELIISIQDLGSYAKDCNESASKINIGAQYGISTVSGDKFPLISFARTRQVIGEELEYTSTSSSSSSSSTSESSQSSSSSESEGNESSSSSTSDSSESSSSSTSSSSESIGNSSSSSNEADIWITKGFTKTFVSVAMSADGQYQTAIDTPAGSYFRSNDWGQNWSELTMNVGYIFGDPDTVAISSDGQYQTIITNSGADGSIFLNNNYGLGTSWQNAVAPNTEEWNGVAISSDGKYQTAVMENDYIYVSNDFGATWNSKGKIAPWTGVAMSTDGSRQSACINGGGVYISFDYGNTWHRKAGKHGYTSVAISADGKYQTAVSSGGNAYYSHNYGLDIFWTQVIVTGSLNCVAMSSSGRYQIASQHSGYLFLSKDYGVTWNQISSLPIGIGWRSVAISADGSIATAVADGLGSNPSADIYICYNLV